MADQELTWARVLDNLVRESAIPHQVHRILLYGPPGTGKSSWAATAFAHVERVTLHSQMPPEDLIGSIALVARKGGTDTVWQDGPAVRAMRRGCALVLNEIDQHSPELRCALHWRNGAHDSRSRAAARQQYVTAAEPQGSPDS